MPVWIWRIKLPFKNVLLKSFSGESLVVLTALINAMILLPFIFLFSPSAFINDKFSRTNVIRYSSLAAVVISAGILVSYMTGMFAAFLCTHIDFSSAKCGLFSGQI